MNACILCNFRIFDNQLEIMKKLILLLALLPVLLIAQNNCEPSFVFGCFPTFEYNPVCGCDDVTYPNASTAACNSILEYTMGACGTAIAGCTDSLAINYNPIASEDDGSCFYISIPGCTDLLALNYNPLATIEDGSCIYIVYGCLDPFACNFSSEANVPDFSCTYPADYYDCNGLCLLDLDGDLVCDELDNCTTLYNPNQLDTDNDGEGDICDYDDGLDIDEINSTHNKLIKMIDVLGKVHHYHPKGKILFYIYEDGTTNKKVLY